MAYSEIGQGIQGIMASEGCGVKSTQSGGRVADDQDTKCFLCDRVDMYMTRFTNWKSGICIPTCS